eukprot:scaffold114840_cov60-Phaeocystis_antarctica.AAC.2
MGMCSDAATRRTARCTASAEDVGRTSARNFLTTRTSSSWNSSLSTSCPNSPDRLSTEFMNATMLRRADRANGASSWRTWW